MKWLIVTLTIVLVLVTTLTLVSAVTSFQDFEGNFNGFVKIDPPVDATRYFNADGSESKTPTDRYIQFDVSNDGIYLSFKATGILVSQVYLKGGEGYRIYIFSPAVSEAKDLICPNNGGNNIPQISHYGLVAITVPTETTTTTTGTTSTTTGTTSTTTGTTSTTSATTSTTTGTTSTTTGTTTTNTSSTTSISTSSSIPTTTSTQEIPKTGEGDNFSGTVIGLSFITLGAALYFLLHKKFPKIT